MDSFLRKQNLDLLTPCGALVRYFRIFLLSIFLETLPEGLLGGLWAQKVPKWRRFGVILVPFGGQPAKVKIVLALKRELDFEGRRGSEFR